MLLLLLIPPFLHLPTDMLAGQHSYVANDERWGFADQDFEERVL
jgi:hypothetical protein